MTSETLPDGGVVSATYDPLGQLTSLAPPGRPAHRFTYTPADLLASYTAPPVGLEPSRDALQLQRRATTDRGGAAGRPRPSTSATTRPGASRRSRSPAARSGSATTRRPATRGASRPRTGSARASSTTGVLPQGETLARPGQRQRQPGLRRRLSDGRAERRRRQHGRLPVRQRRPAAPGSAPCGLARDAQTRQVTGTTLGGLTEAPAATTPSASGAPTPRAWSGAPLSTSSEPRRARPDHQRRRERRRRDVTRAYALRPGRPA